jgi:hypothetical protein
MDQDDKCFACGKPFKKTNGKTSTRKFIVGCADEQTVYVGIDCFDHIVAAGAIGYQPVRKGKPCGPRLYTLDKRPPKNEGRFRISARWIDYAHGPGAESGQALAKELCALPTNKRGQVEISLHRTDLIREVLDVAGLYVGGLPGDTDPQAARVVKRCRAALTVAT